LQFPTSVAVMSTGELAVADGSSRVVIMSTDGKWKKTIADFGNYTYGAVHHPLGIVMQGSGTDEMMYIVDTQNNRIQKVRMLDSTMQAHARQVVHRHAIPGPLKLGQPHGAALAGAVLYVSDTQNHRVVAYSTASANRSRAMAEVGVQPGELQCLSAFGAKGRELGNLQYPKGIAVRFIGTQGEHEIIVCDSRNHRLQCFTPQGQCVRSVGGRHGQTGAGPSGGRGEMFAFPLEVAVSPNGQYIVVADQQTITVLTADGLSPVTIVDPSQPRGPPTLGGTPLLSARLPYPTATRAPFAGFGVAPLGAGPGFLLYVAQYATHRLVEYTLHPQDLDKCLAAPQKPTQLWLASCAQIQQNVLSPRNAGC